MTTLRGWRRAALACLAGMAAFVLAGAPAAQAAGLVGGSPHGPNDMTVYLDHAPAPYGATWHTTAGCPGKTGQSGGYLAYFYNGTWNHASLPIRTAIDNAPITDVPALLDSFSNLVGFSGAKPPVTLEFGLACQKDPSGTPTIERDGFVTVAADGSWQVTNASGAPVAKAATAPKGSSATSKSSGFFGSPWPWVILAALIVVAAVGGWRWRASRATGRLR